MAYSLLLISCGLLAYVYVVYPLLVRILAIPFGIRVVRGRVFPRVTIIVTAYNEQDCIRAKLDNLSGLNYPGDLVDILVASDGSSDATEEIAAAYDPARVRLLRAEGRRGKTACQNAAARVATGEILVFTDATTRLHPDALRALVENFADPTVGCVGGHLHYVTDVDNVNGCGGEAYWSYELRLRANESALGSMIGVSGCLYAVRRSAYRSIEPQLISDFVIAMKMAEQGLRTVLEPDAVCFEATLVNGGHELAMRVRVVIRSLNALVQERRFLNPFTYGRFAWQLWSHKVLRYASPLLWLCTLGANIALASQTPFLILLGAQSVVIAAGAAGFVLQGSGRDLGILGRPYYLLLTNAASLIATLRYLRGERMVIWTPMRH
ncbi:MAG TPA: glycosyltransferase family 2 protein [Steroidobacteraceae bacterium]|jgi:cellulose synthase/poly-beta-1,6-N-acetylglucosamine synthase-like glycosyltransferase|nr:glycosyltransferase family 2 protein [Steroidobacteraceae bacterium]